MTGSLDDSNHGSSGAGGKVYSSHGDPCSGGHSGGRSGGRSGGLSAYSDVCHGFRHGLPHGFLHVTSSLRVSL